MTVLSVSAVEASALTGDGYQRRLGAQLRALRHQRKLTRAAVERQSAGEFRVSALAAYEQGRRAISLARLQRLALLYGVPVGGLLPRDPESDDRPVLRRDAVTVDLAAFVGRADPEVELIRRYVETIQVRRQAFDGGELTIRANDVRALAAMLGGNPASMIERLAQLSLLVGQRAYAVRGPEATPTGAQR
jgi:transcriptional regulator with XRE-family HTH domain